MMKITAIAPANIAFIKYWGKRSNTYRIPLNDSISMNLSGATTTTTVEFLPSLLKDSIDFVGEEISSKEKERISQHLNRIRKLARKKIYAKVKTKNTFPKGTGIASSASGFAALTVAATQAIGLSLNEKELSILARIGSGSACRSIPDGFCWWHGGKKSSDSYTESLFPAIWWDIRDILCVVSKESKKVSSTNGMDYIKTSPYWKTRIQEIPEKIDRVRHALSQKNMDMLGTLLEGEAISMHCVMMTQNPPIFYWNDATLQILDGVYELRRNGIPAYYTLDAGPNVHIICEKKYEQVVYEFMKNNSSVQSIIVNTPSVGTRCLTNHLF